MDEIEKLRANFDSAGQGHVFRFWDDLSGPERDNLISQLREVDLAELDLLVNTLVRGRGAIPVDFESLTPAPYIALPEQGGNGSDWQAAREAGEAALRAGRVAAFTVAGGQGTRLGFDAPKGTFPVSPVRQATLFQVFAEKILSARIFYSASIPWYIMTSRINRAATEKFFAENDYFGLGRDSVLFFSQGMMPAVDFEGRLILEARDSLALSPDGHGGSLRALVRSGATAEMKKTGIDIISYFQVDNPLVRAIDPTFIGFHLLGDSEMSSKMIPKAYPGEKVGHFCRDGDTTCVIEYSDLPAALAEQRDDGGKLRFLAGSIAIHVLDRDFVERVGGSAEGSLPMHRADKKITAVLADGTVSKPEKPNGVKFEMFVFDALPLARHPVIIETERSEDFSPVKNAEGVDSPKTCCEDQLRQYARWAKLAGAAIVTDESGLPGVVFEISPLAGFDRENFLQRCTTVPEISDGTVLGLS